MMKKNITAPSGIAKLRCNLRIFLRDALIVTAYFFAFITLDLISLEFEELRGIVAWYPAVGLTYTLLLVFGMRFTPAVTLALFISSLFIYRMPQPPYLLFLWALVLSLIYAAAATFLRKRIGFGWRLEKSRDVIWLVLTAVLVSAPLAIITVLGSALSSDMPRNEVFGAIFHWWIGETVGVLTVTPFLLTHVIPGLKQFTEDSKIKLPLPWSFSRLTLSVIGEASGIALTLYWVFGVRVLNEFQPTYLIILPLLWITLHRGFKGSTAGIVTLNFGVVLAQWLFRFDIARLGELQLLMIINCIIGLLMGAVVTDRKRAENDLRESEAKYRLLTEFASDVIWVLNLTIGKYTYISPSISQLRGFTAEEAMKESLEDSMTRESLINVRDILAKNIPVFIENPNAPNNWVTEIRQPCKNGAIIWVEVSTKIRYSLNGDIEVVGVSRNIEERKKSEKEVLYLSYHDPLTGLYNRRRFDEEMSRLNAEKCAPLALVMADVNGLKLTNDAFGHQAGDRILEKVANILQRECRTKDILARIGGDEFILLLPETDLENAGKMISRINTAITNEKIENIILSISMGAAVKLDNSDDINEVFKAAEDEMYRHKLSESSSIRSKTLDIIMKTLYEKSNREMMHSKRVSAICEAIAIQMNLDTDNINQARIAGLMHDIGKIGIDEKILNKPGKLDIEEWKEIERHPEIGYRILSSINEFSIIAEDVLEHHEKWNGTGYPRGLKGEEISLQARIIAVADAYDAMTGERTYSKPFSEVDAMKEIRRCSGIQFSPEVAKVFSENVLGKEWK